MTLTKRAHEIEADLVAAAHRVNAAATRGLSRAEVAQFIQTLDAIIANLDGAPDQPPTKEKTS